MRHTHPLSTGSDDRVGIPIHVVSPSARSRPARRPSTRLASPSETEDGHPSDEHIRRLQSQTPEHESTSFEGTEPLPVRTRRPLPARSPSLRSYRTQTPLPVHLGEAEAQLQRLTEAEARLNTISHTVQEAEDQREDEFRAHEEDRNRLFRESEQRRDEEARVRAEAILQELENRIAAFPQLPEPPPPEHVGETEQAHPEGDVVSIRSRATAQLVSDVLDTVKAEREQFDRERQEHVAEREQMIAEVAAEREQLTRERETRIQALENELAAVRAELENEKQQRQTMEAEQRERESHAHMERDEALRNQLGDLTNLVQEQRDSMEQKRALMDSRYDEKQRRQDEKDRKWTFLEDMVRKLAEDMTETKEIAIAAKAEYAQQPTNQEVIDELRRQNAEQRELLQVLSDTWRADCAQHHQETIESVRSTANEQVPFNVQGYLDEFSKALATEVRMLLGEVGKLREERRGLQHELGYLLFMKSKYGPGGEFDGDWKPPPGAAGGPPPDPSQPPDPPAQSSDIPQPAKPGWRTVHTRPTRRKKKEQVASTSVAPQPLQPGQPTYWRSGMDPRTQVQSWATWQPDPGNVPSVESPAPHLLVPEAHDRSPGLFGPRSPASSIIRQ